MYGPEYQITVSDAALGLTGYLIVDNTARGPGKGGLRITPNVTLEEIARLARNMTWKTALADIPFGGAKAGIVWKGGKNEDKRKLVARFAELVAPFTPRKYITSTDVGSTEEDMRTFTEATGNWKSATGKPANLCMRIFGKTGEKCGIPHEFGSTGFGVAHATATACEVLGVALAGATVAIHGFGNVGSFTAQFLTDMGARVVAIFKQGGGIYKPEGFSREAIALFMRDKTAIEKSAHGHIITEREFWKFPVDILIPASVSDVINTQNKRDIRARLIVEAGNIPMQETIERELFAHGVMILPDIVANAGGVISSYAEYRGYNPKRMFDTVEKKIRASTLRVMNASSKKRLFPRDVAMKIAKARVESAMEKKRSTKA